MFRWLIVLTVGATAAAWMGGAGAARESTVTQIKAAVATQLADSHNFVIATSYVEGGLSPGGQITGHAWIDLETGAGRWVAQSQMGKRTSLISVTAKLDQPKLTTLSDTEIDYRTRSWWRTSREMPPKTVSLVNPLAQPGVCFTLLGVERVDGVETYHLRSSYFALGQPRVGGQRWDVWIAKSDDYLIRDKRTGKNGVMIRRSDLLWLPRTSISLALLKMPIPSSFQQVSGPS